MVVFSLKISVDKSLSLLQMRVFCYYWEEMRVFAEMLFFTGESSEDGKIQAGLGFPFPSTLNLFFFIVKRII